MGIFFNGKIDARLKKTQPENRYVGDIYRRQWNTEVTLGGVRWGNECDTL